MVQGSTDIQVPVEDAKRLATAQPRPNGDFGRHEPRVEQAPMDRAANLDTSTNRNFPWQRA
jgi:hypothetical protein